MSWSIDLPAIAALVYVALLSTLAAFASWGLLLRRYGASTVAPFSMLVPFFDIGSAAVFRPDQIHAVDGSRTSWFVAGFGCERRGPVRRLPGRAHGSGTPGSDSRMRLSY